METILHFHRIFHKFHPYKRSQVYIQTFDFLFLDEPFSHLDEVNTEAAFQLIEKTCEAQKAGYVLVSLGEKFGRTYDEELIL